MKKIYNNIGYLLLSMLLFASCADSLVDSDPIDNPDETEGWVPIILDIKGIFNDFAPTYGTDYPGTSLPGNPAENAINDITVYIFKSGSGECEAILTATSLPMTPEMIKTGKKDFIAVVNATGKITLPSSPSNVSFSSLLDTITDVQATLPTSPFLMTGVRQNVNVPFYEAPFSNPHKISIDVERACAKVTFQFKKSGVALRNDITLKKITLLQGADRVPLFNAPSSNPTLYTLTTSKVNFDVALIPSPPSFSVLNDTIYTYESLCGTDKSRAARFLLEMEVNSTPRTAEFYLGEYLPAPTADTVYDVKRNYWYQVDVNIVNPGIDSVYIEVRSSPWNLADTQNEVPGGGYEIVEMAEPFKLVKNYTAADTALQSNIAAIHRHSKGASWFRLQVSDGYKWSLKFKPGAEGVFSIDSGATWVPEVLTQTQAGDGESHLVYVYRPYVENGEPDFGPSFTLTVNNQEVRDFVVQPRDTVPIPTNSYILRPQLSGTPSNESRVYIPLKGVYRYWEDFLYPNGDSIPSGNITAELFWQDREVGSVVKNISVINAGKRDQAYIYAEAGPVQGNAVIVMKAPAKNSGSSIIYWSFHIWVTEYNPYEAAGQKLYITNGTKGYIFMDRNLGALNNRYDAQGEARGLYYQFGRKDPFPRGKEWTDVFACYNSSGVYAMDAPGTTSVNPTLPPLDAIQTSMHNPLTFFTNSTSWPLSVENPYLWSTKGGNKTAFDPCPEGWRIPKQENIGANYSPWANLDNNNFRPGVSYGYGRYHADAGYYPFAGYIGISPVAIKKTPTEAYYWTSYDNGNEKGTGLMIDNNNNTVNNVPDIFKYYGASVRCVVDANYLLNTPGGGLFGNSAGEMEGNIIP